MDVKQQEELEKKWQIYNWYNCSICIAMIGRCSAVYSSHVIAFISERERKRYSELPYIYSDVTKVQSAWIWRHIKLQYKRSRAMSIACVRTNSTNYDESTHSCLFNSEWLNFQSFTVFFFAISIFRWQLHSILVEFNECGIWAFGNQWHIS